MARFFYKYDIIIIIIVSFVTYRCLRTAYSTDALVWPVSDVEFLTIGCIKLPLPSAVCLHAWDGSTAFKRRSIKLAASSVHFGFGQWRTELNRDSYHRVWLFAVWFRSFQPWGCDSGCEPKKYVVFDEWLTQLAAFMNCKGFFQIILGQIKNITSILSRLSQTQPSRSWHKLTFLFWRVVKRQTNKQTNKLVFGEWLTLIWNCSEFFLLII